MTPTIKLRAKPELRAFLKAYLKFREEIAERMGERKYSQDRMASELGRAEERGGDSLVTAQKLGRLLDGEIGIGYETALALAKYVPAAYLIEEMDKVITDPESKRKEVEQAEHFKQFGLYVVRELIDADEETKDDLEFMALRAMLSEKQREFIYEQMKPFPVEGGSREEALRNA